MPYKDPAVLKKFKQEYYLAHKQTYLERSAEWRRQRRAEIRNAINAAKAEPCADCGMSYPYYVMQFDHLDDKKFTISKYVRNGRSIEDVLAEIAKCDVVCANCHAERTYRRKLAGGAGLEPASLVLGQKPGGPCRQSNPPTS